MKPNSNCALIFGSVTGKTAYLAERIVEVFRPEIDLMLIDVSTIEATDIAKFSFAICGIPTWDVGELEYGWADLYEDLNDVSLNGTTIAMFGLGDQWGYGDTYQDAMGILYKKLMERGATGGIGFTSTDGHDFIESCAVEAGQFVGLALDEDNQDELSDQRIKEWCQQVKLELETANLKTKPALQKVRPEVE